MVVKKAGFGRRTEVGNAFKLAGEHVPRRPADHAAEVEHDQLVTRVGDDIDDVLDDQHRRAHLVGQLAEQPT